MNLRQKINKRIQNIKEKDLISFTEMQTAKSMYGFELFYPNSSTRSGEIRTLQEVNLARQQQHLKPIGKDIYRELLEDLDREKRTYLQGELKFQINKVQKIVGDKVKINKNNIIRANKLLEDGIIDNGYGSDLTAFINALLDGE